MKRNKLVGLLSVGAAVIFISCADMTHNLLVQDKTQPESEKQTEHGGNSSENLFEVFYAANLNLLNGIIFIYFRSFQLMRCKIKLCLACGDKKRFKLPRII